eukprot:3658297-Prymnesium_polylepis.2
MCVATCGWTLWRAPHTAPGDLPGAHTRVPLSGLSGLGSRDARQSGAIETPTHGRDHPDPIPVRSVSAEIQVVHLNTVLKRSTCVAVGGADVLHTDKGRDPTWPLV